MKNIKDFDLSGMIENELKTEEGIKEWLSLNLEEYLQHKYDFSQRICNRIASVKLGKMRGNLLYRRSEMHKLMKTISLKMRIDVYYRLVKMILKKGFKKLRSYYAK